MFQKHKDENSELEQAIHDVHKQMRDLEGDSEPYSDMVQNLKELYALRQYDTPKRVSPDTLALVVGNLVGIVLIVGHERAHVVTSKALSFVMKLR